MKRSGSTVLSAMTMEVLMTESSSNRAGGALQQGHFLPILAKQLMDAPEEAIQAFEEIRKYRACSPLPTCCFVFGTQVFISDGSDGHSHVRGW